MRRSDTAVIQEIIARKRARTYLELGVLAGENFFPLRVRHKTAVDPHFGFSRRVKGRWILKNRANLRAKYRECTSRAYFADLKPSARFDVVFVDGLHTYEQSLEDVLNSLAHLSDDGVIVIDDCNPRSSSSAYPAQSWADAAALALPGWTGEWSGEVWKTICHLRCTRNDVNAWVLDCDSGLGIVTRGRAADRLRLGQRGSHATCSDDMVLLDQNAVVETAPVIAAAPAGDGILLSQS